MGSGCTQTPSSSSCIAVTSSNCWKYAGDAFSDLNICINDTGTDVIEELATVLLTALNGTGIKPTGITATCTGISDQLAGISTPTINQYLNAVISLLCTNTTNIADIIAIITAPVVYTNPGCITMPGTVTTSGVLQAVINQLCSVTTQLATLTTEVDSGPTLTTTIINQINSLIGNYLNTNILSCANKGRSTSIDINGNTIVQFNAMVPPLCPIPYIGSLSNFDATGAGLSQYGYCGWVILNGNNGTPDWRGYTFAGATNVPSLKALDQLVDPVYNGDPTYGSSIGDTKGEVKHKLIVAEIPAHSHTATDSGHVHSFASQLATRSGGSSIIWVVDVNTSGCQGGATDSSFGGFGPCSNTFTGKVLTGTANITVTSTGSDQRHENRQPTKYGCWIMRLS